MKFSSQLLALSLFQGTAAFLAPTSQAPASGGLHAVSYLPSETKRSVKSPASAAPQVNCAPKVKSALQVNNIAPPRVNGRALQKNANAARTGDRTSDQTSPQTTRKQQHTREIWDTSTSETVQGGSLRTWSFTDPHVERVQLLIKTEGRPLNADIDLWQGPDNTPQKMRVYSEDGDLRGFSAVIETPRMCRSSIAVRNTGGFEFPLAASVEDGSDGLMDTTERLSQLKTPETIQGGALKTYSFAPSVESIQVLLRTDGLPLNARIELLQGPNNDKQIIELYAEDGFERPFFAVIETPGVGNVVRVVNTAPMEFPLSACVDPYVVEDAVMYSQGDGITAFSNLFDSGARL